MTARMFCNFCDEPGDITSGVFKGITVNVNQTEQPPSHSCADCLASSMLDAVVSLQDTATARDYAETKQRASEASRAYAAVERGVQEIAELKAKLHDARAEATESSRYDSWIHERSELLTQIDALKSERDVALAKIATAERTAADTQKRNQAAAKQAEHEDPAYLASVAAREAKRAAGTNR
jgi:hypothetical protein